MNVESIKACVMREMNLRQSGVSFVELRSVVGESFDGDRVMFTPAFPNILLWVNMSPGVIQALGELLQEKKIEMKSTTPLVYMADGAMPSLPVAKSARQYKTERWLPVCFSVYGWSEKVRSSP